MNKEKTLTLDDLSHCRSEKFKQWDDFKNLERIDRIAVSIGGKIAWTVKMFFTGLIFAIGFGLGLMWLGIV